MAETAAIEALKRRFFAVSPFLDERSRRLMVAGEALALGPGSVLAISRATGVARDTIARGIRDLQHPDSLVEGRVRLPGGGRKRAVDKDPTLLADLELLVGPESRGDPESPLASP
jgi:hypothetical protein